MNVQTIISVFLVLIIVMYWYSINKFKGKILCTFRRANKTKVEKLIPLKSKYVKFGKEKYHVNPKYITTLWYNKGVHQFFPIPVPTLDFRFDSVNALNPETFENTWDSPEAREMAGSEDDYKAFNKGIQAQLGKKSRFPEWLLPAITIGAILVIGYLVYNQGQQLTYLEQLIQMSMQGAQ